MTGQDQPPGNPSWVRILSETTSAQREPLEDGAERIRSIDPTHWSGEAQEGYLSRRDQLAGQWRAVLDIHADVSDQVEGYNTFLHELPHLWEAYAGSPEDLRRLNALHDDAAARLAHALEEQAARLDEIAREPEPAEVRAPVAQGQQEQPRDDREPERFESTSANAVEEPRHEPPPDPSTVLRHRIRDHELLTEQLQTGERVLRIPWKRPPS